MNRNTMYDYLKSKGMFARFVRRNNNKAYHVEFRLTEGQYNCRINTDWGYIRGVNSIHLCMNELVVESAFGDMKVNMFYRHIGKFEVEIEED